MRSQPIDIQPQPGYSCSKFTSRSAPSFGEFTMDPPKAPFHRPRLAASVPSPIALIGCGNDTDVYPLAEINPARCVSGNQHALQYRSLSDASARSRLRNSSSLLSSSMPNMLIEEFPASPPSDEDTSNSTAAERTPCSPGTMRRATILALLQTSSHLTLSPKSLASSFENNQLPFPLS